MAQTNGRIVCNYVKYRPKVSVNLAIGWSVNRRSQSFYFDGRTCNATLPPGCDHDTYRYADLYWMGCNQVAPFSARGYAAGSYVNQRGNTVNVPTDNGRIVNDGQVTKTCVINTEGGYDEAFTVANHAGLPENP